MKLKHRVLIVDDDAERRLLLGRVLADEYETLGVGGEDEALRAIGEHKFDAAIVDYDLPPGGSGLQVLAAAQDRSPGTFRVLYSVYMSDGMRRDAIQIAGAHAAISSWEQSFLVEMRETLARLFSPVVPQPTWVGGAWVANAPASAAFLVELQSAARSLRRVFLYGDPGTGKTFASDLLREMRAGWLRECGDEPAVRHAGEPHVVIIAVPKLRDRIADLPALAEIALARMGAGARLTPAALECLLDRPWRDNVRELFDVLAAAARVAPRGGPIDVGHLPSSSVPSPYPSQRRRNQAQRDCLLVQLRTARTVAGAARMEGCSRPNYIRLMHRVGIESADGVPLRPDAPDETFENGA